MRRGQVGQRGCARSSVGVMERSKKAFKEREAGSLKVITYLKLLGQQALNK